MAKQRSTRTRARSADQRRAGTAPAEHPIVVLFADIVGASEVSNHKTLSEYNAFLAEFRRVFLDVTDDHKASWYAEHEHQYFNASVRGDEGCLMIFVPNRADLAEDIDTAVNIALDLKRRWLMTPDNRRRVNECGLLPSDLAIGIHVGRAYINVQTGGNDASKYRPEGYSINLTKRIEGASRDGKFTRIYVSEAARGELHLSTDELTYTLAAPHSIEAKGISRDIRVYEVKHHFLPTDWGAFTDALRKTRAVDFVPAGEEMQIVKRAHQANPTNLWLAEEYILLGLQFEYERLKTKGKESDIQALREAYQEAKLVAMRFATGDLRDAGILTVVGFIVGEYKDYNEEHRLYKEAIKVDEQCAEAHWYLGFSMSVEFSERLEAEDRPRATHSELEDVERQRVEQIVASYKRAIELNPRHSWVHFDLACELARWGSTKEAIETLEHAVGLNPKIRQKIGEEEYLESIRAHQRIKRLLDGR